jgi:hypothetical protein
VAAGQQGSWPAWRRGDGGDGVATAEAAPRWQRGSRVAAAAIAWQRQHSGGISAAAAAAAAAVAAAALAQRWR